MSVGGWEGLSGTRPSGTTLMQAAFDGIIVRRRARP